MIVDMVARNIHEQSGVVHFREHDNDDASRVKPTTFGQRLRSERERLGITQAEFAEVGGIKRTTQHLYETGVRVPDLNYFLRIKESGADLSYLVLGERHETHRQDAMAVSYATLSNIYVVVDEFCVDADGKLLGLEARLRLFQLLCASLKDRADRDADLDALREQLRFFTGT